MFWGAKITKSKPFTFQEGTTDRINLTNIAILSGSEGTIQVSISSKFSNKKPILIATLSKSRSFAAVNILFSKEDDVQLSTNSDKVEVHLVGNFEPTMLEVEDGSFEDEEYDDSQSSQLQESDDSELDEIRKSKKPKPNTNKQGKQK